MRSWCVVVPRRDGETVRLRLRDRGLLQKHLAIRSEGERLIIPTTARANLGFPAEEREFEEAFTPIRSYKDVVRTPDRLRPLLPSSFDVIGDIAVLKIPEELVPYREEIGRAILAWNRKLRVVAQDHGVSGEHRIREIEIIAGEDRTTTVHTEFGLRYHVDVARAYFSPRLGTERKRVADQVRPGETVVDPFAGVGPFSILIAKRREPRRVIASDANPAAAALLRENVAANRADCVLTKEGDARRILPESRPVDRVILDLPHSALDFLPHALQALGPKGMVHLYGILEAAEREDRVAQIRRLVTREGRGLADLRLHSVRAYSPTQHHVAFDLTVGRA